MSALICGSFAFDTIMVFNDRFKNHILPEKVHILNVSFLVPTLRREFGGCSGNISYNLRLLGGDPRPLGTVGRDFSPYADWMDQCGIDRRHVRILDDTYTGQAFITTDLDDNQITAFHPGAMGRSHEVSVREAKDIRIGIVSPDGREGMVQHSAEFHEAGIPFLFDPGQGMPMFDGADLLRFAHQASWLALNDYEAALYQERTGQTIAQLAQILKGVIVTRGAEGSQIHADGRIIEIPPVRIGKALDPTGCGDAYRAGLLYGLEHGLNWETTGRIASLMGAIKIEHHGTQNHRFTRAEFDARYKQEFGHLPG